MAFLSLAISSSNGPGDRLKPFEGFWRGNASGHKFPDHIQHSWTGTQNGHDRQGNGAYREDRTQGQGVSWQTRVLKRDFPA